MEQVQSFITGYLANRRGLDPSSLDVDANLFASGYVDSLGVFNLLFELENEFGVRFTPESLSSEQVTTIRSLSRFVAAQR